MQMKLMGEVKVMLSCLVALNLLKSGQSWWCRKDGRGGGVKDGWTIGLVQLRRSIPSLCLALILTSCNATKGYGRDYLPGGVEYYSVGSSLNKEYFTASVTRVQYDYALYPSVRWWIDSRPPANPSAINMLQSYIPLHVRWELKDGRQFIAENIDVRAVMHNYFQHNDLKMQWQREGRGWAIGDSYCKWMRW
jgi:predicted small secreted protein